MDAVLPFFQEHRQGVQNLLRTLDSQQMLPITHTELCPKLFVSISIVVALVLFPALFPTLFPDLLHNLLPNLASNLSSVYGNMAPPFVTSLFPQLA